MYFTVNAIDQILQGVELADKSKKDDEIFKETTLKKRKCMESFV
jgi:hypothetical protein